MQTEWSPGWNDKQVVESTSNVAPSQPLLVDDRSVTHVDAAVVIAVDSSPETETVTDSGTAEEEAHRSAVDAVDELLDEVELAMSRLDDGTYGRCETCGVSIDDEELAAGPLVRECAPCCTGAMALPGA